MRKLIFKLGISTTHFLCLFSNADFLDIFLHLKHYILTGLNVHSQIFRLEKLPTPIPAYSYTDTYRHITYRYVSNFRQFLFSYAEFTSTYSGEPHWKKIRVRSFLRQSKTFLINYPFFCTEFQLRNELSTWTSSLCQCKCKQCYIPT